MTDTPHLHALAMTPDQDLSAPQIEWPDEIWALERGEHDMRGEHVYSVFATVARWEGDREGQYHRYVDGDTLDSLKKYHAALIENGQLITLAAHTEAVQAAVAKAVEASDKALRDALAYIDKGHHGMARNIIAAAIRSRGVAP